MSIQKKSLIGNLTAAKKAIVANVASGSQAKLTPTKRSYAVGGILTPFSWVKFVGNS
jgi:hypothetical protein